MKERIAESPLELSRELAALLKATTPTSTLKLYVDRVIIPQMNVARGRTGNMSRSAIVEKIFSIDPDKPGEAVELMTALVRKKRGLSADPVEVALELADIIYYTRQPNAPTFIQDSTPLLEGFGLTYGDALAFCCLKYSIRLGQTDSVKTKQLEYQAMAWYLQTTGPRAFLNQISFK